MGAAAGAGVRPGEGDDTHLAGEDLFAAVFQMFQLLRSRIGDGDGVVLPDVLVGPCLQLGHLVRGELHIQVDGNDVAAHVEAHIVTAEEAVGDAGDDMFSRVVLHQIKTAGPVDLPLYLAACLQRGGAGVDHPSLTLVDLQDRYSSQGAGVVGLSAALGVKGGLV